MTELLTAAQMRAIEQAAIDSGEVTGLELMERAGQGVMDAIFEEWPELAEQGCQRASPSNSIDARGATPGPPKYLDQEEYPLRAVVLCGPGNNGGDGFVVARLLHARGWAVEVFLYGDAEKLPPDARVNYERWTELGAVLPLQADSLSDCFKPELIIDALFGTGLTRAVPEVVQDVFHWLLHHRRRWKASPSNPRKTRERIVSVDIPSGLCSDSGSLLGEVVEEEYNEEAWPRAMARSLAADLSVTFHMPKLAHYLSSNSGFIRKLTLVDIGLRKGTHERSFSLDFPADLERVRLLEARLNGRPLKAGLLIGGRLQKRFGFKFEHGHALILAGGSGHTGAARLAARGALRIGTGLVTLGVPAKAEREAASQLTAIMLKQVGTDEALAEALKDQRINALCLGPALGLDRAKALVATALNGGLEARPTVLDADALSAYADDPATLFELLHDRCVLTPHGGEFARLFPDLSEKLNAVPTKGPAYSKVDATRDAAKRAGCVVLFKGADTVIAAPDGRCSVNSAHYERAAPWLATAGSGDVLAGFITGLLARGIEPMQAAEMAAWLHVECALKFGPGLIAEDIPEQLPAVFRDLGL